MTLAPLTRERPAAQPQAVTRHRRIGQQSPLGRRPLVHQRAIQRADPVAAPRPVTLHGSAVPHGSAAQQGLTTGQLPGRRTESVITSAVPASTRSTAVRAPAPALTGPTILAAATSRSAPVSAMSPVSAVSPASAVTPADRSNGRPALRRLAIGPVRPLRRSYANDLDLPSSSVTPVAARTLMGPAAGPGSTIRRHAVGSGTGSAHEASRPDGDGRRHRRHPAAHGGETVRSALGISPPGVPSSARRSMVPRWSRPLPSLLEPAIPLEVAGPQSPAGLRIGGTTPSTTVRRSAADGRAVVPPRSATADTIRRTPATPAAAAPHPAAGRPSRAGAATGLAGTADLPRTLRRLVEAEAAGATAPGPSVRDLIRQYEKGGRPSPTTSPEGVAMSLPTLGASAPPPVPASATAFRGEQLDAPGARWDPTDREVLETIVDRVVERIEDRVVEELERRGRRRIPGVF